MNHPVLIITEKNDVHADAVIRRLGSRGVEVFRFHPEDYPTQMSITAEISDDVVAIATTPYRSVRTDQVRSVWMRRAPLPKLPPDTEETLSEFILHQASMTLKGFFRAIPDRKWLYSFDALNRAEDKMRQLAHARASGLRCPKTLIGNEPGPIREFYKSLGSHRCLVKPFFSQLVALPGKKTMRMTHAALWNGEADDDSISMSPIIVQEYIEKSFDIRAVVVDDHVFAARIHTQGHEQNKIDSRGGGMEQLVHEKIVLPEDAQTSIRQLLKRFGIRFASIDMAETPEGEFVFLELNPNGQWLWVEEFTRQPISEAIADALETDVDA